MPIIKVVLIISSRTKVVKNMEKGMTNYGKGGEFDGVTHTWDIVQKELECCGVEVSEYLLSGLIGDKIWYLCEA